MLRCALILFLFIIAFSVKAQVLWSENFQTYTDLSGLIGPGSVSSGDYPSNVSKWWLDVSSSSLDDNQDWFAVKDIGSGQYVFEAKDVDGECIWHSEYITISDYIIDISIELSESGSLENSDYINVAYIIDNASESNFSTNGNLINDFGSLTASHTNLTGDSIKILVRANVNHKNEQIKFDDIVMSAKRFDPESFTASSFSSSEISFSVSTNSADDSIMIAYNSSNTFGIPSGSYAVGDAVQGGGTVHYVGVESHVPNHIGLATGNQVHYKIWTFKNADFYSSGLEDNAAPCSNPDTVTSVSADLGHESIQLSWSNPVCSDETMIVMKKGASVQNTPIGTSYNSNTIFGLGDSLGNGEYVVYKGAGSLANISNLENDTTYYYSIYSRIGAVWSNAVSGSGIPKQNKIIFTEIADPSNSSNARFVEIKNVSDSAVNFDQEVYYLSRQSNGGNTWREFKLEGVLNSGCIRTYAKNSNTFNTKYGYIPGYVNSYIDGSGNDAFFIFYGGDHSEGTVVDVFGVVNENGNNQVWEYTDSRAIRASDVGTGLKLMDISEWTISDASTEEVTPDALENEYRFMNSIWCPNGVAPTNSSSAKKVMIQDGTPIISSDIVCSNLELLAGSGMIIQAGTGVSVNNDVVLKDTLNIMSSSSANGSLIISGDVSGEISYSLYLTGGAAGPWHLVTCPVSGQNINDFVSNTNNSIPVSANNNYGVGVYSEVSGVWNYFHNGSGTSPNIPASTAGNFVQGAGYAILRSSDGYITFNGRVATSNQAKSLSSSEWNLIGNPYPCFISINNGADPTNNLISNGSSSTDDYYEAVYIWDANTGDYRAINHASEASYLSPGQGFFVKADADGGDYHFTKEMQSHQSGNWFERRTFPKPSIVVSIESPSSESSTEIKFIDEGTEGFDVGYDAASFPLSSKEMYIATKLVDGSRDSVSFALQCLSAQSDVSAIIPLELWSNEFRYIKLSLELISFQDNTEAYLIDQLLGDTMQLAASNSFYYTWIDEHTYNSDRFLLEITSEKKSHNYEYIAPRMYYVRAENALHFNGFTALDTKLVLVDDLGRLVFEAKLNKSQSKLRLPNLVRSMYIAYFSNEKGVFTTKIIP